MKRQSVEAGIVVRMVAWGGALGSALGLVYPFVVVNLIQVLKFLFGTDAGSINLGMINVWVLVGGIVGLVLGGFSGLLFGLVIGLLLAVFAHFAGPGNRGHSYSALAEIVSIVVATLLAMAAVLWSGLIDYGSQGWGAEWGWLTWGVTPVIIVTGATWLAVRRVMAWVIAATSGQLS